MAPEAAEPEANRRAKSSLSSGSAAPQPHPPNGISRARTRNCAVGARTISLCSGPRWAAGGMRMRRASSAISSAWLRAPPALHQAVERVGLDAGVSCPSQCSDRWVLPWASLGHRSWGRVDAPGGTRLSILCLLVVCIMETIGGMGFGTAAILDCSMIFSHAPFGNRKIMRFQVPVPAADYGGGSPFTHGQGGGWAEEPPASERLQGARAGLAAGQQQQDSSGGGASARCAVTETHAAWTAAGALAAPARARRRTKVADSSAQRSPTSSPNTTRRQRRLRSISGYGSRKLCAVPTRQAVADDLDAPRIVDRMCSWRPARRRARHAPRTVSRV